MKQSLNRSRVRGLSSFRRSGMTLMMTLSALVLVTLMMAAALQTLHMQRTILSSETLRVQADWLITSATNRAIAAKQSSSEYTGETWTIPPEGWHQEHVAQIDIKIAKADAEQQPVIKIYLESPPGKNALIRLTRETTLNSKPDSK